MERTELTEVPTRGKLSKVWENLTDGSVWRLTEEDCEELQYKDIASLRSALGAYAKNEGVNHDIAKRGNVVFFKVNEDDTR